MERDGKVPGVSGGKPLWAWHLFTLPLEASLGPSWQVGKEQRQVALREAAAGQLLAGPGRVSRDVCSEPCAPSPRA